MSFWENDFVQIAEFTDSLLDNYVNKDFIIDVLKEMKSLRKRVPINPGIVAMCARNVVKEVKAEEVEKEKMYLVRTVDGKEYYGEAHIPGDKVMVENFEIPSKEVKGIYTINRKTLEELWPTLVFEVRER